MPETAELRLSEAVPLAHALVARLAELEGVRLLFVKGPTAVALGARPPRPSTDVDVLCEPGGLERLGAALGRCGWRLRVTKSSVHQLEHAAKYLFEHSVHYIHNEWPCDLDIHFNFPGFLAPDDVVFEALWARRASTEIAHIAVPCADFIGQATIVGLHALRDPGSGSSAADLDFVAAAFAAAEPGSLAEFSTFAAESGSSHTLDPLLERLGALKAPSPWADPELLRRWKARTEHSGTITTSWLIELRHTRWRRKLGLIRRALFLHPDELLSAQVGLAPTRTTVTRLQVQRWWRGARGLRRGWLAARHTEQGSR